MKSIGEFFAKFRSRQIQEMRLRAAAQEALKARLGIEVPLGSISFAAGKVVLKGLDQAAKSQIFIKQGSILAELAAALPELAIKSIDTRS